MASTLVKAAIQVYMMKKMMIQFLSLAMGTVDKM